MQWYNVAGEASSFGHQSSRDRSDVLARCAVTTKDEKDEKDENDEKDEKDEHGEKDEKDEKDKKDEKD